MLITESRKSTHLDTWIHKDKNCSIAVSSIICATNFSKQ